MKKKKIFFLIIAAHPDDEILGCGGTAAKLISEGYSGSTLIVSEGITSRDKNRNLSLRAKELKTLKKKCIIANKKIGINKVYFLDFPDNRLDTVALLDIIKKIEELVEIIKPRVIFTHNNSDLNRDHKIVYDAVITACRPFPDSKIKEILSYEVLSSTNWSSPEENDFKPNVYFDITKTINKKLKALSIYNSEMRKYPHARSLKAVDALSKFRGSTVGFKNAEAFKQILSKRK
jgi:LmbE family N-acetylglucosaminyl deacetylase